jgi:hypothetical protein
LNEEEGAAADYYEEEEFENAENLEEATNPDDIEFEEDIEAGYEDDGLNNRPS